MAALTTAISVKEKSIPIPVTKSLRVALGIWDNILNANVGITFDFVLGKLPHCSNDIFVDASTEWGIGGYCGLDYFLFPWAELALFEADVIVQKEMLGCLIAIFCVS